MARKVICPDCGKVVDELDHDCPEKNKKRKEYNKYKREYYEKNKELISKLTSAKWKKFRKRIIKRDGNLCLRCYSKYGLINSKNLEVHHIKPRIEYPELMYAEDNVVTICRTCNAQLGTNGIDWDWKHEKEEFTFNL